MHESHVIMIMVYSCIIYIIEEVCIKEHLRTCVSAIEVTILTLLDKELTNF